ncbi:photosynthetic NDH subunit of subcomplex B chloroplastic [Raphidocelis subcapitata]|uniref:Photosynthetic NDH subunit of subcomplex B chloroplastic n=1 Tax=Raphidocelis subcapitata TaxID=307507 RepID=A0A2V0PL81_9CHLO|nr:photosynthetic NDH subunit of subcomplex B chloroplastic [Raphidocelis subcapitata]|eukprot:GBF98087.1 photosynthetic NDH subunit of subcomplex B chloroplastic [Raphidocelis subcapitata]
MRSMMQAPNGMRPRTSGAAVAARRATPPQAQAQRGRRTAAPRPPRAGPETAPQEPVINVTVTDGDAKIKVACPSGEQLRASLLENKVDLYTVWGKVWQCGGVGQCGTCIVRVDSGAELLSERNETEDRKLKGKPEDWRLACQTIVGDGENSGSVSISVKPQK